MCEQLDGDCSRNDCPMEDCRPRNGMVTVQKIVTVLRKVTILRMFTFLGMVTDELRYLYQNLGWMILTDLHI